MAEQETRLSQELRFDADELRSQLRSLEALNQLLAQELAESDSRRRAAVQSLDEFKSHDAARSDDRQTLAELTREAKGKLQELQKLKQANRVIFNPGQGAAKTPWLVELTPQGIQAAQTGRRGAPQSFADVKSFISWARKRSRSSEYFVLLVKPATIDDFHAARSGLESLGFEVGFDLLRNDQTAIDPLLGAILRRWVGHVDAEIIKRYTHIADSISKAAMQRLAAASATSPKTDTEVTDEDASGSSGSAHFQHSRGSP